MLQPFSFEVKVAKACGIDMHKDKIKACYLGVDTMPIYKDFGTTTRELKSLCNDLAQNDLGDVVIESTGIYWIPLYDMLTERNMRVVIANPLRVKQIPGKKTDTADSEWLCKLLMNGLVSPSFIPDTSLRQLRQLNRQRYRYTGQLSQVKSRILKVLETCNFKLRTVLSNINTKSGRNIVIAIADGVTDMEVLKACCLGRAAKKAEMLPEYLEGHITPYERQLLKMYLKDWDYLDQQVGLLEQTMAAIVSEHYQDTLNLLMMVPGIGPQGARTIVAEIGTQISCFPSADHFSSWIGLAPGNRQSANKWYAQPITKGNKYLRVILIQIAWAAVRSKNGYWAAQFQYLRKRLPAKKAIVAIARKMSKLIFKVITEQYQYEEKGAAFFESQRGKWHPKK